MQQEIKSLTSWQQCFKARQMCKGEEIDQESTGSGTWMTKQK